MKLAIVWPLYSPNLWDYISGMSHMPPRDERDKLVEAAELDPSKMKRVRIWDYFYRIDKEQVGEPQKLEIAQCEQYISGRKRLLDADLKVLELSYKADLAHKERVLRKYLYFLAVAIFFDLASRILLIFARDYVTADIYSLIHYVLVASFVAAVTVYLWMVWRVFTLWFQIALDKNEHAQVRAKMKLEGEAEIKIYQKRIALLKKLTQRLQRQIPSICSDDEVRKWLQEDIDRLCEEAERRSGTRGRLVLIQGFSANNQPRPFVITTPAELQNERPKVLFRPDRLRHMTARHIAIFEKEGQLEIFYGVYSFDFIMITEDALSAYRCFYDFILGGNPFSEQISEHYYDSVVAIEAGRDSREIVIDLNTPVTIDDSPILSLSLSSGSDRAITFVNNTYIDILIKYLRLNSIPRLLVQNWVEKSERLSETALKVIRAKLRDHKDKAAHTI